MTETPDIRYRPDGSIDTDHYIRIGRAMRSAQALDLLTGGAGRDHRTRFRAPGTFKLI